MIVHFPPEGEIAIRRLAELHPGKAIDAILVRALTFYHAAYDSHLQGKNCGCIDGIIEHLDKQDEERGV